MRHHLRSTYVGLALSLACLLLPSCGGGKSSGSGTPAAVAWASISASGTNRFGSWTGTLSSEAGTWAPGQQVAVKADVTLTPGYLEGLAGVGYPAQKLFVLVTAERMFDADGWIHLASDENMSTLLTPTGLAIEGGVQGPVTTRYGYAFQTPLELYGEIATTSIVGEGGARAHFELSGTLPADLPPGLYRLRADFGIQTPQKWNMDLNAGWMGGRPFSSDLGILTYAFSGLIPASGNRPSGTSVDAKAIQARVPWLLLANYNSNGYAGVVPDEDRHRFALAPRNLIPDEVVLPLYSGGSKSVNSYSLEPLLPVDRIDPRGGIAWDYTKGQLSVQVKAPDGSTIDLGTAPFTGKAVYPSYYAYSGPTTGNPAFSAWKPTMYGLYTVKATGWMMDQEGRRYEAGGSYRFWIAKRMTMATATFQGMAYPVGTKYGRDIGFAPAVPADVEITATLYRNSSTDAAQVSTLSCSGKATRGGTFGVAQGMKQLTLDAPGEYEARILARHTDAEGHLWVCVMRHAGVVYPEDSPIEAHGKKLNVSGSYVNQGQTGKEGYVEANGTAHLEHIAFPYNAGDVLLIASEGQGANKIEPVLIATAKGETKPWDTKLNGVGVTNLSFRTSNGYSPHLYPEYITDRQYYYGAAARPGFMGRFIVADTSNRAPYWATSPNSFGGQIAASNNGDQPGDIYRLFGGVVQRNLGATPAYAGYLSSAFILPKGTNNNRIVAAGAEDIIGSTGERARFFLVGLRPGMTYEVGATFRPAVQIDPILPATLNFTLTYPDGTQKTAAGTGDKAGSFAGAEAWPLSLPGVYRYTLAGEWNGFKGRMPGLPESGGVFFVIPKDPPPGAPGLLIDNPAHDSFKADGTYTVRGRSSADKVSFALLMPGAVLEVGEVPVVAGAFSYTVNPVLLNQKAPIYDTSYAGAPALGKVLHLTFTAKEKTPDGAEYWDMRRSVFRGTTVLHTR